jgi:hypothetical protein
MIPSNKRIIFSNLSDDRLVFFLFAIANLIPLFFTYYVGSLDGPKHLFASNVIGKLISGDALFEQYYTLNPIYIGNVLGNYILAFFNIISPAWMAEKAFMMVYLMTFVYGFRYLVVAIKGKSGYFSLLIFPFTHTSLFLMGYYNFSFAIGLLFFSLGFWVKFGNKMNYVTAFKLGLLLLLTYLSHIFIFAVLLLLMAAYSAYGLIVDLTRTGKAPFRTFLSSTFYGLLSALPSLILAFFYVRLILLYQEGAGMNPGSADKVKDLLTLRILAGFDLKAELPVTQILFYFLVALGVIFILQRIILYSRRAVSNKSALVSKHDFWLLMALLFLTLYFILPDGTNAAGSIGVRMLILTMILFVLWLSLQEYRKYFALIPVVAMLIYGIQMKSIHHNYLKPLDKAIREIEAFETKIPANSLIVTMNFGKNWLMYYFQNYFGAQQALVDLKSNSCSPFLAIDWKEGRPDLYADSSLVDGLTGYFNAFNNQRDIADYVAIIGYNHYLKEETLLEFREVLNRGYDLESTSETQAVALFKRKPHLH